MFYKKQPALLSIMQHLMRISRKSSPHHFWKYCRYQLLKSSMSSDDLSRGNADHLTITASNSRQDMVVPAKISEIKDISRTVKLVKLYIPDTRFFFRAGQWVDMFIPGVDTVGGFSMCSAPDLLDSSRLLHLSIKYSKHPPAYWVHSKCKVGDEVQVRAGGDFYYDPDSLELQRDLLLIAGGVGINPLYSILLHFHSLHQKASRKIKVESQTQALNKAAMLFCARNEEELLFREEMKVLSQANQNINLRLHSTRDKPQGNSSILYGRIQEKDIQEASRNLDRSQADVFICGPSAFINSMKSFCVNVGIPAANIHFEQWW